VTGFLLFAALFVALALLFLLPPLLRARQAATAPAHADSNAAVYGEQLEELLADVQKGVLSREEYERAAREVERRIVAENAGSPTAAPVAPRRAAATAIVVALVVPVIAGLGYWQLGVPQALEPQPQRVEAGEMEALAQKLTARLQKSPDDLEGWKLLGQAQFALEQPERAAQAFARALQLAPQDRDTLLGLLRSLAMAGHFRFEKGDYAGAIGMWEKILGFAPPDSEIAKTVKEGIAEAQALAAKKPVAAAGAAGLSGTVRLSPELAAKVAPGDTVFVLARAAEGPRMPLAVARITADKLPYRFALDDSMAMAPGATISSQAKLVVVARISRAGKATPAKGDIEGSSKPVAPGAADIEVVLSRIVD
jgi:cytochrome c-type biogenesis protein CcmH